MRRGIPGVMRPRCHVPQGTVPSLIFVHCVHSPLPGSTPVMAFCNTRQSHSTITQQQKYSVQAKQGTPGTQEKTSLVWPFTGELSILGWGGGGFRNAYELLNIRALWIKHTSFNVWVRYFVWNFKRVPLKFHTKYLAHTLRWKIEFLYHIEIFRGLRPPQTHNSVEDWAPIHVIYGGQSSNCLKNMITLLKLKYRVYYVPNLGALSILKLSLRMGYFMPGGVELTHWGRVTHICVDNLTIIGSDNGLSPGRRQAIIWTNAGILLIGPLGTIFN